MKTLRNATRAPLAHRADPPCQKEREHGREEFQSFAVILTELMSTVKDRMRNQADQNDQRGALQHRETGRG